MSRRTGWVLSSVVLFVLGSSGIAHAGPVELLEGVSISPSTPKNMVVPYNFGGMGLFISQDGGQTLNWLCNAGIATGLNNRHPTTFLSGDDHIYLGLLDGLWRGGADGCGFEKVPELDKKFARAITGDPIDPKRTYVATSSSMMDNYIYMSDGSSPFAPLGAATPLWIDTLFVVKNGTGRRFYESVVTTNATTNEATYSVRVSDDDAKTWTEDQVDVVDPADKQNPQFSIVAVDPQNPDHVLGHKWLNAELPDVLYLSKEKGKKGTWQMIAQPVELGGAAFTPDGKLYFGDSSLDVNKRGLYVIDSDGAEPKRVYMNARVFCVNYDDANKRLLGCANNYWFGTFDPAAGTLTPLLDLRCAEHQVKCADKPDIQDMCQPPGVEFCKLDHWLLAPLCKVYDRGEEFCDYAGSQSFQCVGGKVVDKDEGTPIADCAAGSAPVTSGGAGTGCAGAGASCPPASAGASAAGTSAAANGGTTAANSGGAGGKLAVDPGKSGCGCSVPGSTREQTQRERAALLLLLVGAAIRCRRRSQRRPS